MQSEMSKDNTLISGVIVQCTLSNMHLGDQHMITMGYHNE